MRHAFSTASLLALLAAAPAAALAQMNGPPGQNADQGNMGNPQMGPGQNMPGGMGGNNPMSGPGMMGGGPGAMGGGPMAGPGMMGGGPMPGPGMMGAPGMGPGGMYHRAMRTNDQDRKFVEEAGSAGLAEVKEGELAERRGEATAVRVFGRWMATDHTEMGDLLDHHARRAGLAVPSELNARDREQFDQLQRHHGGEFDMHYLIDQVDAHKQAIELFKEEAQSGANPALRWFARHMQTMLTQHLAAAQELRGAPESAAARSAHVTTPSPAPMAEAVKAPAKLQEGTTPAVRQNLNQQGAERIEKEGK